MSENIAIVAESEIVCEVIKHYLIKKELSVRTFSSGVKLFECCSDRNIFSAIILDLSLPDITGIDLYDLIRKKGLNMPVFFVSSKNISSGLGKRLRRDSKLRYYQKPLDAQEIANEVWRIINEKA